MATESNKQPVLLIHGGGVGAYEADRPLADSLQGGLGPHYEVRYPQMPDEHAPSYEAWRDAMQAELDRTQGEVMLVGHSLGASVALKFALDRAAAARVRGLFLMATPYWGAEDWDVPAYALGDDWPTRLRADLPVFLYHSRDDEVVPFSHLALYRERLPAATVREFEARGHQFEGNAWEVASDILMLKTRQ